jgi:hypothetical protein
VINEDHITKSNTMKALSKHKDRDGKVIKKLYVARDERNVSHEIFDKQGDVLVVHSDGDGGRTLHDASERLFASLGVATSDIPELLSHFLA